MPRLDDYGHELAEESLRELERRFSSIYSQAAREMREKQEKEMAAYQRELSQRLKALDDTPEARKKHEDWLAEQAMRNRWVGDMSDRLAQRATEGNELAMQALNDTLPTVYAENANWAAYTVDKAVGYDTSFTLVDADTVRNLVMGNASTEAVGSRYARRDGNATAGGRLLPEITFPAVDRRKDYRWNRQRFNSAITQGILQGESIPNIVKRTESIFGMNKAAATRAARTATTCAENSGRISSYERAQGMGIELKQEWVAALDGRTRSSHRKLDGVKVAVGEEFEAERGKLRFPGDPQGHPSEVYNCFIGDTEVYPLGGIERGFKRLYNGEVVTVHTAGGVKFTCTPNHPIMTANGWVAAKLLRNGDHLVVARRLGNLRPGVNPNVEHVGTRFDALFELLEMLPGERACGLSVDFHGDASASDVEVVSQERPLRVNGETFGNQPVGELGLVHTDSPASGDGTSVQFGRAALSSTDGIMGGGCEPAAFFRGSVGHALVHGLRAVTRDDAVVFEPELDDVSANAKLVCDALDRGSFLVSFDDVVSIDASTVSCHVYNLQTESGAYLAGQTYNDSYVLAHNCRCTVVAAVDGVDQDDAARWSRLPDGMTYDEWREGKPIDRAESYKNPARIKEPGWARSSAGNATAAAAMSEPRYGTFRGLSYVDDGLGSHWGDGSEIDPQRMIMEDTGFNAERAEQVRKDVSSWVGQGYKKIRLEEGDYAFTADRLDEFIAASPKYMGTVYRGIGVERGAADEILDTLRNGGSIDNHGIASWATESDWATEFMSMNSEELDDPVGIIFQLDENRSGVSIKHIASIDNDEVVAPRGIKYELVGEVETVEDPYEGEYLLIHVREAV